MTKTAKSNSSNTPMIIRNAYRTDLMQLMEIEQLCHDHPCKPYELSDKAFSSPEHRCIVGLTREPDVCGFILFSHSKCRRSITIEDMAVHPSCQRKGWGSVLMEWMLASHRERAVYVTVPDNRLPAHLFFKSLGFVARPEVLACSVGKHLSDSYLFELAPRR